MTKQGKTTNTSQGDFLPKREGSTDFISTEANATSVTAAPSVSTNKTQTALG